MSFKDLQNKLGDGPGLISARPVTADVTVSRQGSIVILKIGNSSINMNWRTAMTIGQWLMVRAQEGKILEGMANKAVILDPPPELPNPDDVVDNAKKNKQDKK
jgi:hypothetical protein